MKATSPQQLLKSCLARYNPAIRDLALAALAKLRTRLAGAIVIVYDNYNALVIGFAPTERPSEAVLSLVLYPRYVSVCFLQGAHLPDPKRILQGAGNQVRHIRLTAANDLDQPAVRALIGQALLIAQPFDDTQPGRIVIRSVSAKQRPRRPAKK